MDIKVTFPKKPANEERLVPSLKHYRELPKDYNLYFKIGNLPAKGSMILGKDRIYYGWDNNFWGSLVIKEIRYVDLNEAAGLGDWDGTSGNFIISDGDTWQELPEPVPYKRGFQSFRYWNLLL